MTKYFYLFVLIVIATMANAQTTQDAKDYINTNIVTNGTKSITASKLNTALNKIIDAIDSSIVYVDSNAVVVSSIDSTYYTVLNYTNTPPSSPITGAIYAIGNSPTGAWIGHAKEIAIWNGSAWSYIAPEQGDFFFNITNDYTYQYRNGSWVRVGGIPLLHNGNTITGGVIVGTNNNASLAFETNNINRGRFDSIGRFHVYNLPTAGSADTFVNVSNTSGQLSKVGKSTFLNGIGGGGGQIAFTKTKAEIDTLIAGNDLVAGALYEITGVHPTLYDDGTTSGTTVYLRAISGSELEVQGMGKFYNPKYNQAVDGFGIWENKMYGTFSSISGTFDYLNKEAVTADNSATGILLADGMIQYVSGNWSTATSITGGTSGATANVVDFVSPSYAINDKVIWGGYSWKNVNGNIGASTDVLNLDSEWTKDVYDTSNYNVAYDLIEYDYSNDWISRRYDAVADIDVVFTKRDEVIFSGNFHAIQVQQFGNTFNLTTFKGIFNKRVINAYDESINFCGAIQYNLTFGQYASQSYLTFGQNAFQNNLTFGQDANQSYLTFGQDAFQSYLTFGQDAYQSYLTFGQDANQSYLTFGQDANQSYLIFGQDAKQSYLTFGQKANQNNLTFGQDAYQSYLTFGQDAFQSNLIFGQDANQYNLTFGQKANQNNLTFGQYANQQSLTFGQGAFQSNLTFGQNANQYNLTFGQYASQSYLTFGQNAYQSYLTFENNASQYNLTFGSGAIQQNLNFAEYTQLDFNNQTLNSNMEYVSFRTKAITVPDLSTATYIFDGNIKEVYQRPDGTIKLKFMNNSDVLEVHGIAD